MIIRGMKPDEPIQKKGKNGYKKEEGKDSVIDAKFPLKKWTLQGNAPLPRAKDSRYAQIGHGTLFVKW